MKISPARLAAFDALWRIECDRSFSAIVLPAVEKALTLQDAGLCHELALGVLRRQIYLDRLIDKVAGGRKLDTAVRLALRLGIYQLLFLDRIPAHAAINESVELVRRAKKVSARGFVNAILRSIQKETPKLTFVDEHERIAVETSHPEWLIKRWADQFGLEASTALAEANNCTPRIAFRRTRLGGDLSLPEHMRSSHARGGYVAERMTPELRKYSSEGLLYFQDEGSQIVADAVPSARRLLDVCAAPGGKVTQIAARPESHNALIVAGDRHVKRVDFLRQSCVAQGVAFVNAVQYDAADPLPFAENSFGSVLVDAPCSGTGTIAHNPEIRYFLQASDFAELSRKQLQILRNASKVVAEGGILVYSTCSLETEENETVCGEFMKDADFEQLVPDVPGRFITKEGFARTFPARDSMDGFFIAAFRKR